MRLKLMAATAAAALATASGASAQGWMDGWFDGWAGFYVAADVGYHWPEGLETSSTLNSPQGSPGELNFGAEDDWAGFGRLGYRFNPNWRLELEGGYRPGDIESVRGRVGVLPQGLCTPGVLRTAA